MNEYQHRGLWILTKWSVWACLIYYLWDIKFFHFVFIWLPWLIAYIGGQMVEYGAVTVLRYYAFWWYVVIILLIVLGALIFEFLYRWKRRDFRIGGHKEGRVIWAKGDRTGFVYDVWDAKNYLLWKFGKKKGSAPTTDTSKPITGNPNGTLPSAWDIPIGNRDRDYITVYVRRTILPSIPERFFIPRTTKFASTIYTISVPNVNVERVAHPRIPGRWDYYVDAKAPRSDRTASAALTRKNRTLLKRSGEFVENAIASDSETKKRDWEYGSFDVPQLRDEDGAYDE